ncbi:MAG TPA: DUF3570 domain-containing protein [Gammaproteobacteria bacterium]
MAATKDNQGIKQKLALATCSLLSQQASGEAIENDWVFDSSFVSYNESDDRVKVNKFIVDVSGTIAEGENIDLMVILDTMTGSTPTGGVQSSTIVSVTGTSGSGGFSANGNATALAPFDDTRLAVKVDWEHEVSSTFRTTYGSAVSVENDYTSLGGSFTIAKDTASKLTTFTTGLGFAHDEISQTGGVTPEPLSNVNDQRLFGEGERDTFDFIAGVTRVLGPRTLWQNNIGFMYSEGYHTDPYKVVSIANDSDVELDRIYESRPDKRERTILYSKLIHSLSDTQTMHLSYRYYADDWEIEAHTLDYTHRFALGAGQYIEPHVRYYTQTKADFFQRSLPLFTPLPEFVSADNRLDDMQGATLGVKFGKPVGENGEVRARLEMIGWQAENAVIDETTAVVLQLSFQKGFY